eukprot:75944_1
MSSKKRKMDNDEREDVSESPRKKRKLLQFESNSDCQPLDEATRKERYNDLKNVVIKDAIKNALSRHGIYKEDTEIQNFVEKVMNNRININETYKSHCSACKKYTDYKSCTDCNYKSCANCAKLEQPILISRDMPIPCNDCISNERRGVVPCFDCKQTIVRNGGNCNVCIHCDGTFCGCGAGSSCQDCYEYQCKRCSDMEFCDGCGELLCTINGCFMDHEELHK